MERVFKGDEGGIPSRGGGVGAHRRWEGGGARALGGCLGGRGAKYSCSGPKLPPRGTTKIIERLFFGNAITPELFTEPNFIIFELFSVILAL